MNDPKSLLGLNDGAVGSYVICDTLADRVAWYNITTANAYRNTQVGGNAFEVRTAVAAAQPTVVYVKQGGIISITVVDASSDGTGLLYAIQVRVPGDSGYRALVRPSGAPWTANSIRLSAAWIGPLPAGTEIVVEAGTTRGTGDDSFDTRNLIVAFLAPCDINSKVRYGA